MPWVIAQFACVHVVWVAWEPDWSAWGNGCKLRVLHNMTTALISQFSLFRYLPLFSAIKYRFSFEYGMHYGDAIMGMMASKITSLTIIYSTIYSGADQRKHQSSASLAFEREFTGDRWIPRTNGQQRGKCLHLVTSSCIFGRRHNRCIS